MKQVFVAIALIIGLSASINAQETKKEKKEKKEKKMEMKAHVCTAACANGKHMYAHGEKGHTCTEDCKKKM